MIAWRAALNELSSKYGIMMEKTPMNVGSLKQFFENLIEKVRKVDKTSSDSERCHKSMDKMMTDSELPENRTAEVENDLQHEEKQFVLKDPPKGRLESDGLKQLKSTTKGRPQSDRLKLLEYQTECKLVELTSLVYIPTRKADDAKKLFEQKRSIFIEGEMGEGKSTTAYHLMAEQRNGDKCVVLKYPRDGKEVIKNWEGIVMIDDIFGQRALDPGYLKEWMKYLPDIQKRVDEGKLRVIITSRSNVISKAPSNLTSLDLFSADRSLTISSRDLNVSEKTSILSRYIDVQKRDINKEQQKECIANFSDDSVGFFLSCVLFANVFLDEGPDFFRSPKKRLFKRMSNLKKIELLALAFLFCLGEIRKEHLSPRTIPFSSKQLLHHLALCLNIQEDIDIRLLYNFYYLFLGSFFLEEKSYDSDLESQVEERWIRFSHSIIFEVAGLVLAVSSIKLVIKYGHFEFLYQKTSTAQADVACADRVFIKKSLHRLLAKRIADDLLNKGLATTVLNNSALEQDNVKKELKDELLSDNKFKRFLEDTDENTKALTMCDMAPIIKLFLPR